MLKVEFISCLFVCTLDYKKVVFYNPGGKQQGLNPKTFR
uniref:Uncharacterized protein n=1 Tax=Arundo donax TaxID=35708 RepID=A0A0A9CGK9_ARUDO